MEYIEPSWGVVIVAYNPDVNKFKKKIEKASEYIPNLVIINNGERIELDDVDVINLEDNKGIAYAQNYGVKYLSKISVDVIFFFDQDSKFDSEYFSEMLKEWLHIKQKDDKTAMLSPLIVDEKFNNISRMMAIRSNSVKLVKLSENEHQIIKNTLPISSGVLVERKFYELVGGTKPILFNDLVDHELDLNLIRNGFSTYSTNRVRLLHNIGNKTKRKLLWKNIYPYNYPLTREYFYMRNSMFLIKNYSKDFKGLKSYIGRTLMIRLIFTFYEPHKIKRANAMIKGIFDGVKLPKD
ncbi:glycosyltransferase [Latilactobacillus curvatus]|uniref:hypothetical protein n=1 Tax=Latilactobacillus curvatus TaxID=28038 RepID=UPI002410E3DB|nr:hypothetical protein [Latilactobacillus curvatus]MDG2978940.1 glycosyltransferase [Latilactobacillus curvatus]